MPQKSRWRAFAVLSAVQLVIIIDSSIVYVALPTIQTDLGFSPAGLAWVVNAYMIAFGGLLLLSGRLGDLIGRKRMFVVGLSTFTAASLLCGLAVSQAMLVAARFVQGAGGAMASAVVMSIIVTIFQEPRELAKAVGAIGFVAAVGGAVGGTAGGLLTQAAGWSWIFFVNVPIGVVAVVLAVRLLADDRGSGLAVGADITGAFLVTAGLMVGVYTIVKVEQHGWGSAHTLGLGAVSIALLAAFAARQASARSPLMPLGVFRSRNLAGANLVQVLMVASMSGFQFLTVLYLQRVVGYGAAETSLAGLPIALVLAVVSLGLSARMSTRFGPRAVLLAGLVLLAAALAWFTRAPVDGGYLVDVLPSMVLLGVGGGLAMPAVMTLAMSGVRPGDAGLASGLAGTGAQVGGALGLAALAALASGRTARLTAAGQSTISGLNAGYHLAFGAGAGLLATAVIVGFVILRPEPAGPPQENP
ncbi:MFS transporter [Sphaerisporangium melleum]|uniref:MFS transporter n=1 Tax=Sphaerisporangium melleum TaxID=321316 RepID=A0A917VPG3_9ACTN|nr:MFS transporter [Sphaerisporangium melleum]GGL01659.1 MFS transporter [Sphaerisporangium melleum]GII72148.1 MFS transporter [Sphaerisporangium melleum]